MAYFLDGQICIQHGHRGLRQDGLFLWFVKTTNEFGKDLKREGHGVKSIEHNSEEKKERGRERELLLKL